MKTKNIITKLKSAVLMSCLLITISGCSSMQTTNTGFLETSVLSTESPIITVYWHNDEALIISREEQRLLTNELVSSLEIELSKVQGKEQGKEQGKVQGKEQGKTKLSDIHIKAVVTRVETISEPLNWLSTLVAFAPLDRGGVAVEFEAFDIATKGLVAQLNFARWTPMSEFAVRYDRLAPAEIGMASAANAFVSKLQNNLSNN